jgi:hypothetical protein
MGFSQQCLENIKNWDPPDSIPCTAPFCASIQTPIDSHCNKKKISPDTPITELDPNLYGPGKPGWCYCCCSCFGHDTPIEASPGEYVLVQDIRSSDLIMAASLDSTGQLTWQQREVSITDGIWLEADNIPGMYLITYTYPGPEGEDNRMMIVTADHLFLMDDATLKPVQQLAIGDRLRTAHGGVSEVTFVVNGSFTRGVHSVQMIGEFDGTNLDGHLLNANGIVCADYAVQVYYACNQIPQQLMHASTATALVVGTPEYAAKYKSAKLDAFLADEEAWPLGFAPTLLARTITPPAIAHPFLTPDQAKDVKHNAPRTGQNNTFPALSVNYLFTLVRGMYPNATLLLDWTNELPNAYSWQEWGRQTIVITGGLARVTGLNREGISLVIAEMLAYEEEEIACVGPAGYEAVFNVMRTMWDGSLFASVMPKAYDQVAKLFSWVEPNHAGEGKNVCKHPSLQCRLATYQAALSMFEIPSCAVPHAHVFVVRGARGTAPGSVTVQFNEKVDVPLAETIANYAITPKVSISNAKVSATNAKVVRLEVKGLVSGQQYMVAVSNVTTNTGVTLDPQHDAVAFRAI